MLNCHFSWFLWLLRKDLGCFAHRFTLWYCCWLSENLTSFLCLCILNNFSDFNIFRHTNEDLARHERIISCVMSLVRSCILDSVRSKYLMSFCVENNAHIVSKLFIFFTFCMNKVQWCFAKNILPTVSCEYFGVEYLLREILFPYLHEVIIFLRQWSIFWNKLTVNESEIVHHVVPNNRLFTVLNDLNDSWEAKLSLKHRLDV